MDAPSVNLHEDSITNAEAVVESLRGELQESRVSEASQPGGVPRGRRRLDQLDLEDVDPADAVLWCSVMSPELPPALLRRRPRRGGTLVIVRDVSSSMAGLHAKWGSSLALRLVALAERTALRLGYAEFHDKAMLHYDTGGDGGFLTRDYGFVRALSRDLTCDGLTNYQQVLQMVLAEMSDAGARGRSGSHHLLLLTDGHPTQGCRHCHREAELAVQLGVRLHAVFVGADEYPAVLARLASATGGRQFQAVPNYESGVVTVHDRSRDLAEFAFETCETEPASEEPSS